MPQALDPQPESSWRMRWCSGPEHSAGSFPEMGHSSLSPGFHSPTSRR